MKQVILVRMDLQMPKGKLAAQCAHASVESVLKSTKTKIDAWKKEGMTKVVLKVKDKRHLMLKMKMAKDHKVTFALIQDAGRTFFKDPTVTCLGIGPDADVKIDTIVGNLKLL